MICRIKYKKLIKIDKLHTVMSLDYIIRWIFKFNEKASPYKKLTKKPLKTLIFIFFLL